MRSKKTLAAATTATNVPSAAPAANIVYTNGYTITSTVEGFAAYDTIAVSANNLNATVGLAVSNAGNLDLTNALDGMRAVVVTASDAGNEIIAGGMNDTLQGGRGDDTLRGAAGNDTIFGGQGNDTLDGGDGDDTLVGQAGDDTILGGAGDDTINDNDGRLDINAGAGKDTIYADYNRVGKVDGGADRDVMWATGDLTGLSISNVEVLATNGYGVTATVEQLDAFDVIVTSERNPQSTVTIQVANGGKIDLSDELAGQRAAIVTASDVGNEIIAGDKADTLWGRGAADILRGGAGADAIYGGAGNDTLDGGDGNDTLNGQAGDDTILGGAGDDTINDDSGMLNIDAGTGNDVIYVGDSRVGKVDGGADRDVMWAAGDLTGLSISNVEVLATNGYGVTATVEQLDAFDVIVTSESNPQSTVTIQVANGGKIDLSDELAGERAVVLTTSAAGNEVVAGDKADMLFGQAGNDVLYSGKGNDLIQGGAGNDMLDGGDGDDTINGHSGDDIIRGGAGDDIISDGDGRLDIDAGAGSDTIHAGDNRVGKIDGGEGRDVMWAAGSIAGLAIKNVEVLATNGYGVAATATTSCTAGWGTTRSSATRGTTRSTAEPATTR